MEMAKTKVYKVGYITPNPNDYKSSLQEYINISVPEGIEISFEYIENALKEQGIKIFTVTSYEHDGIKTVSLTGGDVL